MNKQFKVFLLLFLGCIKISYSAQNIIPPFSPGESWYVCQGYNAKITHHDDLKYSLDLSFIRGSNGPTGCNPNGYKKSQYKKIYSPVNGKLSYFSKRYSTACINFDNESITIGHIYLDQRVGRGSSVIAGKTMLGRVRPPDSTNNYYDHIHMQLYKGKNCVGGNQTSFNARIKGKYLYADGSINQWSGVRLTRPKPIDNTNSIRRIDLYGCRNTIIERKKCSLIAVVRYNNGTREIIRNGEKGIRFYDNSRYAYIKRGTLYTRHIYSKTPIKIIARYKGKTAIKNMTILKR